MGRDMFIVVSTLGGLVFVKLAPLDYAHVDDVFALESRMNRTDLGNRSR
jgi:hypothetical protein